MKKILLAPIFLLACLMMIGCGDDSKKSKKVHDTIKAEKIDNDKDEIEDYFLPEKKKTPMSVGYGITIVDIRVKGNQVIYDAECDESIIPIDVLKEKKSEAKESVISMLKDGSDPKMAQDVKFCKKHNVEIVYRYIGKTSGNTCEIKVSPSEM